MAKFIPTDEQWGKMQKHIKGETTCTSNIDKTFLVDSGTQTYDRCYDLCLECYGKGDSTNNNCKKCDGNYFLENKDSKQCVDQCDLKLVPDAASGICINCKTHLTNKEQYKDPITNTCTDTIRNGYYVDDKSIRPKELLNMTIEEIDKLIEEDRI